MRVWPALKGGERWRQQLVHELAADPDVDPERGFLHNSATCLTQHIVKNNNQGHADDKPL